MSIENDILSGDAKRLKATQHKQGIVITPKMQEIIDKSRGQASPEARHEVEMMHRGLRQIADDMAKQTEERVAKLKAKV